MSDPRPPLARSCNCFADDDRTNNGTLRWRKSPLHDDIQDTTSDAWKWVCDQIETGIETEQTELDFRGVQVVTLPRSIGRLTTLRRLYLYGSYIARLPRELGLLPELTKLEPYTSYNLHYYPYELARAPQLRLTIVSTRPLYGNVKFRPRSRYSHRATSRCRHVRAACAMRCSRPGRHRYWTSRRVASDVMPLLINACSAACLANALPPAEGYVAKPHRGGPNVSATAC